MNDTKICILQYYEPEEYNATTWGAFRCVNLEGYTLLWEDSHQL